MRGSIISFVLLFCIISSNFAFAVTWSEITRFTGTASSSTNPFTCSRAEWRINWNYKPNSSDAEDAVFVIYVFQTNETGSIGSITKYGNTTTSDTSYIHNRQGEFHLQFIVTNLENYTAVIEQDIDSVPEFSPIILLSLLTTGILVAIVASRRQGHLLSRCQC